MSERLPSPEQPSLTEAQETALSGACERFGVEYRSSDYRPTFDLPEGWVAGWLGGYEVQAVMPTLYVGCDPEGRISS